MAEMGEERATTRLVRLSNQRSVLNTLFDDGPLTSQELTKRLRLSHPTISTITKGLMEMGLVVRGDTVKTIDGRPPAKLQIAENARFSVGAHVTGGHIRIAVVNFAGNVVEKRKHPFAIEPTGACWRLFDSLLESFIKDTVASEASLVGVGVAVQAPVENVAGEIRLPGLVEDPQPQYGMIQASVGRKVVLNNDAKMAAYAQVFRKKCHRDVVFLLLGREIGGAIISAGKLYNEGRKNAEFGHMTVALDGRPCACGKRGCLSAYCSTHALRAQAGVELDAFFAGVEGGRPDFCALWDEYLDYLAVGINNLRMIFDTDVIIGGEMSGYIRKCRERLDTKLAMRNSFGEPAGYMRIGEYGEFDAAVGAALYQLDRFLEA